VSEHLPHHMIRCTDSVMAQMHARVMEIMHERGLIVLGGDPEANAGEVERVLAANGCLNERGDTIMGRPIFLPGVGAEFALLLVTPCPADEYDDHLQPKPSPIKFARTSSGQVVVPARWIMTKLEELAQNPSAPEDKRARALTISRRGITDDTVLPLEAQTVAIQVRDRTKGAIEIEALPAGILLAFNPAD
jgi:hypothetical protein